MKIISEYRLTKEAIADYRAKGYEVYYGYEHFKIKPGESVGILLEPLYTSSIMLIENLLYRPIKSKITLSYDGDIYHLTNIDDWRHTYQDEHDQIRVTSILHPVLQAYKDKAKIYYEHLAHVKALEEHKIIDTQFEQIYKTKLIITDDITNFVRAFAHLYDIEVDYNNNLDIKKAYMQIKFYFDNDIPYTNEPFCIDYHDEPLFSNVKFLDKYADIKPDVIEVGDEQLLEDLVYKCKETSLLVDQVLDVML